MRRRSTPASIMIGCCSVRRTRSASTLEDAWPRPTPPHHRPPASARSLALERNTLAVVAAMFLMALGENLWRRFLPKYLESLGAPIVAIGAYGSTEDALDGLYQYPGGWASDRYGRRHALLLFVSLAAAGYVIIAAAPAWPVVFVGLLLHHVLDQHGEPDAVRRGGRRACRPGSARSASRSRRSSAACRSSWRPTLGGALIAAVGIRAGVRAGLMVSVALALVTLARRAPDAARPARRPRRRPTCGRVWRSLPGPLRRLLISDICIRTCDAMVDVFLVLYAVNVVGISAPAFGGLIGVQTATVILCSLPAARLADRVGRKPFVIATFVAFAALSARRGGGALAGGAGRGVRGGRPARDRRAGPEGADPRSGAARSCAPAAWGCTTCSGASPSRRRPPSVGSLEGVADGAVPPGRRVRRRRRPALHADGR